MDLRCVLGQTRYSHIRALNFFLISLHHAAQYCVAAGPTETYI